METLLTDKPNLEGLITVRSVAKLRKVAIVTVNNWIHNRENPFPAFRIDGSYEAFAWKADALAYAPRNKGKPKGSKQTGV